MKPTRRAVLAQAMANRSLRRVLAAYLLFNLAEWANWIALLIWGYERSGVRGASALALIQLVPATLLAPTAANLLARLPRRRAVTMGYVAQSVSYVALGVALATGAPYAVVAVLAAVGAVAVTFTRPVHNALLPELAETTAELTAANTASGSMEALAAFGGPMLSAIVIIPWGLPGVLFVTGAGMGVAFALTARLHRVSGSAARALAGVSERTQLRKVARHRTARVLSAMVAAEYVLVGMMDILLVVLALDLLGLSDSGPGLLNSALGVGAVLGAAGTVALVGRDRLAPVLLVAALVAGVPIALAGQVPGVVLAVLLLTLAGAGKLFVDIGSKTLVQRAVPEQMLVAVFGVQEAMMMAGLAIGSLLAPVLVTTVGAHWAFVAAGAFLPVVTGLSWWGLRDADAKAVVPGDVFDSLAQVPLLAVLVPRTLERLARGAHKVAAPAGTVVINEGDAGDLFYVIVAGSARATKGGTVLRELGPGDWFGEIALLRDVPRTATVTTTADTDLVCLERAPFLLAVTGTPRAMESADVHRRGYADLED